MYVSGRTPTRTLTIPNAQLREITKRVMGDPRVQRAMEKRGMNRATAEKSALSKLSKVSVTAKPDTSALVRKLERKLALETSPLRQVEIRRALAFAKLEGGAK